MKTHRKHSSRRGFTLLEIIVVIAIFALLSGVLVPVAGVLIRQANTDATVQRLDKVSEAVNAYFRDTFALPEQLSDLAADPGVGGWSGPYLLDGFVADASGVADLEKDGFAKPLQVDQLDESTLRVRSLGADGAEGGGDDLDLVINVAPIRRERTIEHIQILNAAILSYNKNLSEEQPPLPADVQQAFSTLVGKGYLPDDSDLLMDGWGDLLVSSTEGAGPLVGVKSTNVGAAVGSGAERVRRRGQGN